MAEALNSEDDPPSLSGEDIEEVVPDTENGPPNPGLVFFRESDELSAKEPPPMKPFRSIRREILIVLVGLGMAIWFVFFSGRVFHSHAANAANRSALVQLHQAIELGATADEVRELFKRLATPQLELHDERATDWKIRMPMEFGATDWQLLLAFQENKVARVRLVTTDGPPPKDGPPDKIKP